MRLLPWLLCAAAAIIPVLSTEEKSVARPKRDSSDKKIVCYYTNWSVYRPGTAKFSPQNINPYLCTHLIYAFGGLSKDNALKPFDKYQDIEQGGYAKFNGLKTYNKNLKTMLAIGGWNEGSARFSPLVADAERRRELVKNTVKFLRQNHFDGLDLDWEYPSFRDGGKPRDRDNYATLVQEFREEFERESEKTGRSRLLLTMAVPAGIEYIDKGYDVPKLNKYLDWMNILSYDYHSAFEPAINHHSPLFSLEEDDEYNFDAQLSIDYTVKHYIKLGAERSKLVLGIPTYGRSYTLFNPDATDIGSPADGPGEQGDATREKGYLAYYEICERVSSGGWTEENPYPDAMGPYAYKDNQWVGYDDEGIARAKAKYVNDNDLGGIMFWSIDNDDFRGKCHGKPYPIIEAAKEALLASANELVPTSSKSESSKSGSKKQESSGSKSKGRTSRVRTKSTTTTEASKAKSSGRTTTTPQPPTTPDPGSDFVCKDEGFFPHPRDCKKYFWCLDSGPSSLGIVAHQFTCPSGLVFNKISDSCDYARNVICKNKAEASTTTTTTTTTTSTTTARTTTARSRLVITASPPRTTSTTTEPPEEEEEEEEEEDEEDPGTIKELISLIKKLGGVEQLEKQLNLQNSDAKEKIKPSLYSKVLQGRTANRYRGVTNDDSSTTQKYVSVFRNRAVGPHSSTTEESSSRSQDKPRYVTIQRNRATKKPIHVDEESESEEEIIEEPVQPKTRPSRRRPNLDSTTEREYVTLRRSRPPKDEEDLTTTSKYKNVVRVRSTTEAVPEEDEEEVTEEEEEEEDGIDEHENEEDDLGEEEGQEEARKEDGDSLQKFKKYSSISRDKKIPAAAVEEEETKVSGPQRAKYEGGVESSTTEHTPTQRRDDVNNVHRVTSPRYVEIRRTQAPTTEPSKNDVNIIHNAPETDQENKVVVEDESGTRKLEGFQSRSTTISDTSRRLTRPPFRSTGFTIEVTPSTVLAQSTAGETEVQRLRGRFRSTTESSTTPEIKSPFNRYKTINRSRVERPRLEESEFSTRFPKTERVSSTTTTTSTTTTNTPQVDSSTFGAQRRFQFAPRTKPTVLTPKVGRPSTTETFTITVPDLPEPPLTENVVDGVASSPSFPSVTLEPTTNLPSIPESANFNEPENDVGLTGSFRTRPSTRYYIPTTSTQTSVVTSITESLFTERGRILVPKKSRGNFPSSDYKFITTNSSAGTEPSPVSSTQEVTRPSYRPTGYKTIVRSTTTTSPKPEITKSTERRRFKGKSSFTTSTTTTEEPKPRYVPKKIRNFKKVVSTETPPTSSTTTQRARFTPRNRFRQTGHDIIEPVNSFSQRFGNTRKRKIISQKDDDLAVEQTETYFGDTYDHENDRFVLGGEVRQHSDNDYLNAVFVFSQSTTESIPVDTAEYSSEEEEENQQQKNALEKTETTAIPQRTALKNLRIRPALKATTEFSVPTSLTQQRQTSKISDPRVNSIYKPNPLNLASLRAKNQNVNVESRDEASKEVTTSGSSSSTSLPASKTSTLLFQSSKTTKSSSTTTLKGFRTNNLFENTINGETIADVTTISTTEIDSDESKTTDFVDIGSPEEIDEGSNETLEKTTSRPTTSSLTQSTNPTSRRTTVLSNFRTFRTRLQPVNTTRPTSAPAAESEDKIENENEVPREDSIRTRFFRGRIRKVVPKGQAKGKNKVEEPNVGVNATQNIQNFRNFRGRNEGSQESSSRALQNRLNQDSETDDKKNRIRTNFRVFRVKSKGLNKTAESDVNSSPEDVSEEKITRGEIRHFTKTTDGPASAVQYKTTTRGSSSRSTSAFQEGSTTGVTAESSQTSGSSPAEGSASTSEYLLDPSIGTTFGLKTGVSLGVTKSLSSPVVSTERPTTSGLTTRTLRPIVVSPAGPTLDSAISSSVDSAVRIANLPSTITSKSSSQSPKDSFRNVSPQTSSSRRPVISSTNQSEIDELPTTNDVPSSISSTAQTQQTQTTTTTGAVSKSNSRKNFKVFKTKLPRKELHVETEAGTKDDGKTGNGNVAGKSSNGRKRVLVRGRPVQQPVGVEEAEGDAGDSDVGEDVRTEAPPTTISTRLTSSRRGNQDHFIRNRIRSTTTTTQTPTTERQERRRTLLDRRRLKQEYRSTTVKPEVSSETYSSTARSNVFLRRRTRPTTSSTTTTTTTSTTTTTTEPPYLEIQEDSSLEESKTLDESPGIQDLADPAVVAIHTLATVSPGGVTSGRPLTYFGPSSGTPDTYTVHVTPGDIESITPGRIASITPGTARPTSILTLKPFTIPVITKTPAQVSSISLRTSSPFRANGIPLVTEQPYISSDEILEQARRLETIPKPRPVVTASTPRKSIAIAAKSARPKPFSKVPKQEVVQSVSSPDPATDYEYYDEEDPLANIPASALKVKVHSNGYIECLDRGNFPHPFSCKKFISCAKMENNELLGWEYTCPKHLSFDPVGGICNWSAGLGCQH